MFEVRSQFLFLRPGYAKTDDILVLDWDNVLTIVETWQWTTTL